MNWTAILSKLNESSDLPGRYQLRQHLFPPAAEEAIANKRADRPGVKDKRHLIGQIDPMAPVLIQQMRRERRLRHMAVTTEGDYTDWGLRFMKRCRSEDLQLM